ncbi:MAG: helix-turn-helix transcriptional regulator [Candidatus Eisenbacteria bacterium]|uniref:Helix-turn-helix transcriptional regulator n=1 Tax=Eiseniibacteriota bacterium TaxID=2212470 RepID=A0A849SMD7_UNCEI|nr:helix-turn-helix transcriptional regulator [Candidatus Eisenbacteria bacterium]
MSLGAKLRDLRQRKSLTIQQLADATGLSKGFVSQVENGHAHPSLTSLRELAKALATSIAYLVVDDEHAPHVVRANERPQLRVGGNTSRVELLSAQPKRNLELIMAELPPGLSAGEKRHFHHGEEILFVVEGRVRLAYGPHIVELGTGDTCHFDGRTPHGVENSGDTMARVIISMTPAAFEPLIKVRPDDEDDEASRTTA